MPESHWSICKECVIGFAVFRRKNSSKILTDIVDNSLLVQCHRVNLMCIVFEYLLRNQVSLLSQIIIPICIFNVNT